MPHPQDPFDPSTADAVQPFKDASWSDVATVPEAAGPRKETFDGSLIEHDPYGVTITLDASTVDVPAFTGAFNENLALHLPDTELTEIGEKVTTWVDEDDKSREKWVARLKEGAQLLGLEELTGDGDSGIPGASKLTHPLIAEVAVQFQARAIEELFPSGGPVNTVVLGDEDDETRGQGDRVRDYMNYHLTERDEGYFPDLDQMLFLEPCHGSIFRKVYRDPVDELVKSRYVDGGDFIVPYSARSLRDAPRYTHRFPMPENDYKRAVANGVYKDIVLTPTTTTADPKGLQEVKDKADDRSVAVATEPDEFTFYECHCDLDLSVDRGKAKFNLPYIVTVEKESQKVVAIRRNWKELDSKRKKRIWVAHFKYLPGLGFYGFGLLHIIGILAKAAGGSLRALLDAASRSNFQGGFVSKESRVSGDVRLEMGKYVAVDMTSEELRSSFYTPEFPEPSAVLFKLMDYMVQDGRRFASVVDAMVGDAPTTGPVGTIIAQIEQGSKIFSGVHKRNHGSQRDEFRMIAELLGESAEVEYPYHMKGQSKQMFRRDFDGRVDVIPVSDPSIYSNTQRIALAQGAMQLIDAAPDVYDQNAKKLAHKRLLTAMKYPNPEELFPKERERLDPVTENQLIMFNKPVKSFFEQDHAAHAQVHTQFMMGLPPEQQQAVMPIFQAHLAEHNAHAYRQSVMQRVPIDAVDLENPQSLPLELETLIARAVANSMPPAQGQPGQPGGPNPEEIQKQMEELGKQQAELLKQREQLQDMMRQMGDKKAELDRSALKMKADHENFMSGIGLREREVKQTEREAANAMAQKASDLKRESIQINAQMQERAIELERLEAGIDSKLERLKDLLADAKAKLAESAKAGDGAAAAAQTATVEALMKEVLALGDKAMAVMSQPRVKNVAQRDGFGRIQQVIDTPQGT